MSAVIRQATRDDAATVCALHAEFAAFLRRLGDQTEFGFGPEAYLRDGFGPDPIFSGLVAEVDGSVAGYLLYRFGYDTDRAIRTLHILDLYVHARVRRRGAGRALIEAAADICRKGGGRELTWAVYTPNKLAFSFYDSLGAKHVEDLDYMFLPVN